MVRNQILARINATKTPKHEIRTKTLVEFDVLVGENAETSLRACLDVVLWRRKWLILGSHKGIFEPHSGAMGRKNGEVRFQKWTFAAQTTTSKQALKG